MKKIYVPPIKCQGIKTKLVSYIKELLPEYKGTWYEPFMGSGVVGFNIMPKKAIFSDTNPHLINIYNDIKYNKLSPDKLRNYLEFESEKLLKGADEYYKEVRARFNNNPNSFDFIFLNRACFNGMMRFNSKGGFNVPFCKKPNRYSSAYITKIVNQVKNIQEIIKENDYQFIISSFDKLIPLSNENDFIYCDPPYIDRYSNYFGSWSSENEKLLYLLLTKTKAKFILSTWHNNKYRKNTYIEKYWKNFNISQKNHFYFIGASEQNRNEMIEALVYNFDTDAKIIDLKNKNEKNNTPELNLIKRA